MNRPLPPLLTCVATCVLAIQPSSVLAGRSHAAPIVTAASASAGASEGSSRRTKVHAPRKTQRERSEPSAARAAPAKVQKLSRQDIAEARKAAALEQAQAQARADDLYAASQTNAPIIDDAKACKRIGANGESIYENC